MAEEITSIATDDRGPGAGRLFVAMLKRDLQLSLRRKSELVNPLTFFLMVITLFPLGVSPEAGFLSELAPGVLWVAALLATLLSMDSLFRSDFDDGTLEQLLLSPQPLYVAVLAKVLAHWMLTGLALTLVAPLIAVMLFLPAEGCLDCC